MAKVSILIPSRNERFLPETVRDLLAKARGDVELIVVLEGYWEHALPADKRLKILHHGTAQGMRPALNAAAQMATGEYLLKSDAHCLWAEGYDEALKADYLEHNWILTPRRYALDAEAWAIEGGNNKYPVDYEYLSYPFERPDDPTCGLHGTPWTARREARKHLELDTDMSSQGSAWFMSLQHWHTLAPLNLAMFGNFYGESQEIGLQTQLRGGAMMRTKRTWYAHLRKGRKYGRGYSLGVNGHRRGAGAMLRLCMLNQWPGQVRSLQSLVEEFAPVPGWPADLDACFAEARARLAQETAA
jgi:glycosyltransferase involved in cell wall biosynthesis